MRNPSLIFCGILCLFGQSVVAQMPMARLQSTKSETQLAIPGAQTELPQNRNLYQRAYKTNDGRIIYQFSKAPLNYKNNKGDWMPIDLKPITNQHGFIADKQNNPVALAYDGTVEIANTSGSVFSVQTTQVFGTGITDEPIANKNIHPSLITNNNQYFTFLTQDVIQRSEFRHNGIKVDYIFPNRLSANNGIIQQQLICDKDFSIIHHPQITHALSIRNKLNEEMGILFPIICKDASGQLSYGDYSFEKNESGYLVQLKIHVDWFNSPERTFPVIVDPLIVGPTALWGASYMPSCLVPAYNVDSLLVTIPGQTTITGVFVSASYYADPFAGAIMSQGQMYFTTSCGQSPNLSVDPPAGNSAGTAYLTNFDYRNPLTCCLGPSCSDRTFYVRMHLGRTAGGAGCTTSYIYYDAFTLYPFSVYVEGRTPEATGTQWIINPTTLCSDQCNLTYKPYIRYGVPPYTLTHPWASGPTILGTPLFNCALTTVNADIAITRPGCPIFCDTATSVNVPLPTIVDACGNAVTGMPPKILNIKPTPQINITTDSLLFCSGDPALYNFTVCPAGTQVNWTSPGFNGVNSIDTLMINSGPNLIQTTYIATASLNGCNAAADSITFFTSPNPQAGSLHAPVGFVLEPINFADTSNYFTSSGGSWQWSFGDGSTSPDSLATHTYAVPGTYNVCLYINSQFGCKDTICDTIKIIPNIITLPNVITTNGDGINDVLYFQYLPFYGISSLSVYNRWGVIVYESNDYQNNWAPNHLTDGTYFYILKVPGHDPYTSTLNIFNKP